MPSAINENDGKSIATELVEGLVEGMMQQYEAAKEAFRIPLGVQEVTMDGLRKWWDEPTTDYEQRMQFVKQHGVEATMRMLRPGLLRPEKEQR